MAERKVKQWITVNGVHVPIFEGESKADAVKKAVSRYKKADKTKGAFSQDSFKNGVGSKIKFHDSKHTFTGTIESITEDGKAAKVKGDDGTIYKVHKTGKLLPAIDSIKIGGKTYDYDNDGKMVERANKIDKAVAEEKKQSGVTRKDVEELTAKKDALKGTKLNAKPITKEEVEANQKSWGKQTETQKPDLSTEGTYKLKGEQAPKDLPRVSDEDAKHNKTVEYDGQRYQTQPVVDYKKEEGGEYVAGHMYVPIDPKGKGSFFVSKDGEMYHSGSDYLQAKAKARWAEQANKEADEKEKQIARNNTERERLSGNFEAELEEHSDPEYKNVTDGVKTEKQTKMSESEYTTHMKNMGDLALQYAKKGDKDAVANLNSSMAELARRYEASRSKSVDDLKKEYDSIKGNSQAEASRRAAISKEMGNKIVSGLVPGQTYKVPTKNGYEELKCTGSKTMASGLKIARFETPNGVRKNIERDGASLYGIKRKKKG